MNWDPIQAEQEAYQSYLALLDQARRCAELYERAELDLPERVQRLLGMIEGGARKVTRNAGAHIQPPERINPPKESGVDWISIDAKKGIVTTVMLAILRSANGGPVRSKEVTEKVREILQDATPGSVANAGTRVFGDSVERTDEGWKLIKPEKAAILHEGRLWGPPSVFVSPEIAAHRRDGILHILKAFPTGLQIVQIVEQLKNCSWVKAPVSKDLLKMDMQVLRSEEKVRQVSHSKKWQISEKGE
jgi:hypothetical protein